MFCRPGGDLLSQVLRHSTIGARAFDGRVRDGIGSNRLAKATRPAKHASEDVRTEDRGQRTDIHPLCLSSAQHSPEAKLGVGERQSVNSDQKIFLITDHC